MERFVSIFLAAALLLGLSACSGGKKGEAVSMYDLSRAMTAATDFAELKYNSSADSDPESLFAFISDMDYEKVDSFFVSYAADGAKSADEVAVVALRDAADVDEATASLKAHLQKRQSAYATYAPDQSEKASKGIVFSQDNYVVLIISGDNEKVKKSFSDFLSNNG